MNVDSKQKNQTKKRPVDTSSQTFSKAPEAYQKGHQDFYGLDFIVSPDVLIPRPETEQLIDIVLNLAGKPFLPGIKAGYRKLPEKPTIVDVGTGSGCIAITIKKLLPEATVYALDISENALKVARKNAKLHQETNIILENSNLLKFFIGEGNSKNQSTNTQTKIDLIVANLPYVNKNWDWIDKEALSYEPEIALYAEEGGLHLIKKLIEQSANLDATFILLEADPCQHQLIIEYAKTKNYQLTNTEGFAILFQFTK